MDTRSRTLKLALLADTSKFGTNLDKANKQTQSFSQKMKVNAAKIGKAFALAGVAVAGMAAKLAVDGVKAAMADEKAQVKLALTLKNTTKASNLQIKSVEKYIDKLQRATGVSDDKLRPSLSKLLVATKDITKAQKLQALAMDVAAGTGKDLDTVSLALAKAYGGNLGALTRLGITLDASIIKNKDFDAAAKELNKTFTGQSAAAADTMSGKFARFNVSIEEAKESIGVALMPAMEELVGFLNGAEGQKMITDFAEGFAAAMKGVAAVLPGIVSKMKTLVTAVGKGDFATLFADERLVAAGLAYGAGLYYGGPQAGALAALAAYYGADQLIGRGNEVNKNVKSKATSMSTIKIPGVSETGMDRTLNTNRLYGGLTGNLKATSPVTINVTVNGAADARESARAIQKTLNKIKLNGGAQAGILGFN
jgi:hypothetical protein